MTKTIHPKFSSFIKHFKTVVNERKDKTYYGKLSKKNTDNIFFYSNSIKILLINFISIVFTLCSFAQTQTNEEDSDALYYIFTSLVKNDAEHKDNTYTREVEIFKTTVDEKIIKYDFFCTNFEFKGPNNISYIRRVAYIFDEISILVDDSRRIIDVTKPADMDQRWKKTKEKILLEYKGEIITNYLKQIDQTIEDKEKLMFFLQSDDMYGLFIKASSELDNPAKTSEIKINIEEGTKIITPKNKSNEETEQYTFKGNALNYAVKTVSNIKYEIKFLEQIKL